MFWELHAKNVTMHSIFKKQTNKNPQTCALKEINLEINEDKKTPFIQSIWCPDKQKNDPFLELK